MFNNSVFRLIVVVMLLIAVGGTLVYTPIVQASDLVEKLLKTFGIGFVVDRFADQINDFINTLTLNRGVEVESSTKVVPIITVGTGSYIGAVQVSGPRKAVEKVKAVAQLEGNFRDDTFRIRALVPVNTKNPTNLKNIGRVKGVGITALVDINI